MTILEAMAVRTSLRTYLPEPIDPQQRHQLQKAVDQCNRAGGLSLRLIYDQPTPLAAGYGILTGVQNYLVLAGPSDLPHLEEKCGYYGEQVLLTAVAMGLGTCWVGATYDKRACQAVVSPGETLVCAIALGHTPQAPTGREKLIRAATHRTVRSPQELAEGLDAAPAWFRAGAEALCRAPSAMNRQGYRFAMTADGLARARRTREDAFSLVDLGIAKYHFELGAHGGSWTWGDGGTFRKAEEEKSCGAVVWRGSHAAPEILLARHNGGHWSFPKGHGEGGETEAETARREIREETGLLADIDTAFRQTVTYYPKANVVKDVIFFTAQPTGGTEHAQEEEIAQIGWFSLPEALERVTYATDEEVLLAAAAYLQHKEA